MSWTLGRIWVDTVDQYFCVDAVDQCFCVVTADWYFCWWDDDDLVHSDVGIYFKNSC